MPGLHVVDKQEDATKQLPAKRNAKHSLPTNRRIMSLFSMAVVPEERRAFRRRFRRANKEGEEGETTEPISSNLCHIPISWVAKAFQCEPFQLQCAGDMFPESRIESEFLNEFYIMDAILNQAPSPARMGDPPDNDDGNVMMLTRMWCVRSNCTNRKTSSLGRIIVSGLPSFFASVWQVLLP